MTATHAPETNAVERLIQAIEALDAAGYSCWFLEVFSIENMVICLDGIPTELPLLRGEIELIASAHDEIMSLAEWSDAPTASVPRRV